MSTIDMEHQILCDVAHSKILLCATSHKIFANGASSLFLGTTANVAFF